MKTYHAGEYLTARPLFRAIALSAQKEGFERTAAMNWNNAGACSLAVMQYGAALEDFNRASSVARATHQTAALGNTLNNLASLYVHMHQPEEAIRAAFEGLALPAAAIAPGVRSKLRFQMASSLMELHRTDEAEPMYLSSINELIDLLDLDAASRELGLMGLELVKVHRFRNAEWALSEALRMARTHRLPGTGNILRGLANLRSEQGDARSAATLFDAALAAPPGVTPRWGIFNDRGKFRLLHGNLEGALEDFRQARRIAYQVRADIVPADGDRVALEGGLSELMEGLVNAGNLLSLKTGDERLLRETFDAAEQDRLWSLRALVPSSGDWRSRLPEHYWELLARYQAHDRASLQSGALTVDGTAAALKLEIQQMEAAAAGGERIQAGEGVSPLIHVQNTLDSNSVLLSFHITKTSSWVWAVDREHTFVVHLPALADLSADVDRFRKAIRSGAVSDTTLFRSLFGRVPREYLQHKHWLLEADGPLTDMPFSALITGFDHRNAPVYLIEQASLQLIPSALLMEHGAVPLDGAFLGVSDPVYNEADPRFTGLRRRVDLTLPRLPNTRSGVESCARTWNGPGSRVLAGNDAGIENVEAAMKSKPAIIHFATHVVPSAGEFRSGLIALSLGADGVMGLLGPKEIIARTTTATLVVMDGCHSSQGEALPSAGLMGLTRAWIGAGASAVMATQWDVPDEAARSMMTTFYQSLRTHAEAGMASALRDAQLFELNSGNGRRLPGRWAGYFLLSRI